MSLKINGRTFNSLPLRFRGGAAFEYAESNKASQRNIFAGQGVTDKASGNPAGHLYPSSWLWPQKSGSITAFKTTFGSSTAAAVLALGLEAVGSIAGTSTTSADLTLLLFGDATSSGTSTADASLAATAAISAISDGTSTVTGTVTSVSVSAISGSIAGTSTAVSDIGALVSLAANISGSSSTTALIYATAFIEGEITPFTELSPQSLAIAVWSANASQNNDVGTMGELLNGAGGGATPSTIAAAVWDALLSNYTDPGSMGLAITELQTELSKKLSKTQFLALK